MPDLLALNGQIIGGVPLPGENYKKLWENPSPTSTFGQQTITLNSDDYDFLMVEYTANASWVTKHNYSNIIGKGIDIGLQFGPGTGYTRLIKFINNTTLEVQTGYEGSTTSNNVCVPLAIYAIKKDALAAGSGGVGGGHIIEDAEGTDLDQQDTLQFKGTLRATNDSTNGKTIVDDSAVEIEWDDWQAMTEQEREAYLAENPKVDILNFPDADADLQFDFLTKLWENSDSTQAFAGQTRIELDSADYDFLLSIFNYNNAGSYRNVCAITKKGDNIFAEYAQARTDTGIGASNRILVYSTDKLYIAEDAMVSAGTTPATVTNTMMIPLVIYGFKKKITLTVDAIAENVSTSASKCMLEDGETSVEDKLNEFCYKPGDVISFTASDYCYGLVTGNDAIINVPINKPMQQVSSADVTFTSSFGFSSILGIRTATGVTVKSVAIGKASIQITLTSTSFASINSGTPIVLGTNFTVTFR